MASMAAFLFGVLLAFTIVRTRERLVLVQDLVAKSDATLLTLHDAVTAFADPERDEIRDLVDRHLTDQIDYRLVDYHRASPSFRALIKSVLDLRPNNPQQEGVYKELVARCFVLDNDRALIEAATGQAMSPLEWTGLLMLLVVLLGLLAVLPGGTPLGSVVAGVMAGALVTLMILLRKLDLLRWHEQVTIWEPTTRLFRSMGRDPYVPREVIDSGRYRPPGRVRRRRLPPKPYPIQNEQGCHRRRLVRRRPVGSVNGDARMEERCSIRSAEECPAHRTIGDGPTPKVSSHVTVSGPNRFALRS